MINVNIWNRWKNKVKYIDYFIFFYFQTKPIDTLNWAPRNNENDSLNEIELIIEKNQYLIAADTININEVIFEKLNKLKMELNFAIYED